jgi:hypothetical protein
MVTRYYCARQSRTGMRNASLNYSFFLLFLRSVMIGTRTPISNVIRLSSVIDSNFFDFRNDIFPGY